MIRMKMFLSMVAILLAGGSAAWAEDDMRSELDQAKKEIAQLRLELEQMKQNSNQQYQQQLDQTLGKAKPETQAPGQLLLPPGWTVKPYGYIKGDYIYDDSDTGNSNVAYAAPSEVGTNTNDDRTNITARQSRLGAIITAPNIGEAKVRGVFEMDFYGNGDENSAALRIRKAYGEIIGKDWSFMFGQDWELFSPLFPDTLNFMYGGYSGNPGYRYPQLRGAKWFILPDESKLKFEAGVQRELPQDLADEAGTIEDGRDSAMPTFVGRASWAKKGFEAGLSGHVGQEELDWDYVGDDDKVRTWSLNGDLQIPIISNFKFQGEAFWAENYDCHYGNTLGINPVTGDEVEVLGGWAEIGWKPKPAPCVYHVNLGSGYVDPQDDDLLGTNAYCENQYYYSTVKFFFSEFLWTGLEVSYYNTDYMDADDGDLVRLQHSWCLQF